MRVMAEGDEGGFRRRQKVVAAVDLPGVPAGTRGTVMYVAGFSWKRYRVRFDNGVERGSLDGRYLETIEDRERAEHELRVAEARAEQERLAEELRAQLVTPSQSS